MKRLTFPALIVVTLGIALLAGWSLRRWQKGDPPETTARGSVDRGALLYQMNCAACHGPEGHGDGASAAPLKPPPRDFAARPWKFTPSLESIRKVVHDGIPGTAMPGFHASLSAAELEAVGEHVLKLANPASARPSQIASTPPWPAGYVDLRGTILPNLTLTDSAGAKKTVANFKGSTLLLHFWGTSCVACVQEMPSLNDLEKHYDGRLRVIHVCTDLEDAKEAQAVLDRRAPGCRTYVDESGFGMIRYEIQALPTSILIDAQGQAIARNTGTSAWQSAEFRTFLERFLPVKVGS